MASYVLPGIMNMFQEGILDSFCGFCQHFLFTDHLDGIQDSAFHLPHPSLSTTPKASHQKNGKYDPAFMSHEVMSGPY